MRIGYILGLWLSSSLLSFSWAADSIFTSGAGVSTPNADAIIKYLNTVITKQSTEDAGALMAKPPEVAIITEDNKATMASQAQSGKILSELENTTRKIINNKEIMDIAFGLYGQLRPGEEPRVNPFNPYVELVNNHKSVFCSPSATAEKDNFTEANDKLAFCEGSSIIENSNDATAPYKPCNYQYLSRSSYNLGDVGSYDSLGRKIGNRPEQQQNTKLAYGDIKLSGLLEPSGYIVGTEVIADEVIRNLINPFANAGSDDVQGGDGSKDIGKILATIASDGAKVRDAKHEYAKYLAKQAALEAARYSLNQMFAMRLRCNDSGFSTLDILAKQAQARFTNNDWYEGIKTTPLAGLLRELVYMESFEQLLDYYQLQSEHRQEVLEAVYLANNVRTTAKISSEYDKLKNLGKGRK